MSSRSACGSQSVQAGLSRARAQGRGKVLGRPKAAVRPERVMRLRERGLSIRHIAAETDVSAMTVQRILKGEEAVIRQSRVIGSYSETHPALLTAIDYQQDAPAAYI